MNTTVTLKIFVKIMSGIKK